MSSLEPGGKIVSRVWKIRNGEGTGEYFRARWGVESRIQGLSKAVELG